jgi:hypothetical protein
MSSEEYPKELRWWFEEWKPKHEGECDCKGCNKPLIAFLKSHFNYLKNPENHYRQDGVTINWIAGMGSKTRPRKVIKLLESHGLIHGCYAQGRHSETVYKLGSAAECKQPENH